MFCVWKVSSGLSCPTFFRSRFPAKCFAQTKDMRACVWIMVPNPKQLACLESNNLDQFGSSKLYLTLNIPNQCLSNCHPWHIIIVIAANLVPWELILRLRRIWCGVDETTSAPSRVSQVMVGHGRPCRLSWAIHLPDIALMGGTLWYVQEWYGLKMVQVTWGWRCFCLCAWHRHVTCGLQDVVLISLWQEPFQA